MWRYTFLVGALLSPSFVVAAEVPTLTSYTISNTTICPAHPELCSATTSIDIAFNVKVKVTLKVVAPDGSAFTLYSSSGVTDPRPKVWDGTANNEHGTIDPDGIYTVSITASSVDDPSLTLTDTSRTITVSSTGGDTTDDSSGTPSPTASASTYTPPPSSITLALSGPSDALLNVPVRFTARVIAKSGVDTAAQIVWSFGDGSSQTGTAVEKVYRYPGTYLITAHAVDGGARASDERIVTVHSAGVHLSMEGEGIVLSNETDTRLDLSDWRLTADVGSFRIPEGTTLLPHANVLFPYTITNLPIAADAALLYPNTMVAARSISPMPAVQPSSVVQSSYSVQAVDTNPNATPSPLSYDQAVVAPTASTELAAVGAPLPATTSVAAPVATGNASSHTPWLVGLIGIIAAAGGAFILL